MNALFYLPVIRKEVYVDWHLRVVVQPPEAMEKPTHRLVYVQVGDDFYWTVESLDDVGQARPVVTLADAEYVFRAGLLRCFNLPTDAEFLYNAPTRSPSELDLNARTRAKVSDVDHVELHCSVTGKGASEVGALPVGVAPPAFNGNVLPFKGADRKKAGRVARGQPAETGGDTPATPATVIKLAQWARAK